MSNDSDFSDFISVQSPIAEHNILFLIDTEACVSIVKSSIIKNTINIDKSDTIFMKGITQKRVSSIGSIKMILIFEHISIENKMHIVPDGFLIPSHGIIGKDFTKKFNCVIDYGNMNFTIAPKGCRTGKNCHSI